VEADGMKHYVMTRSAYGPAWDKDANRRRLEMTVAVTVASMADQTSKDWTWIVLLDRNDPLKAERRAAFQSAGVPVKFFTVASATTDRSEAAAEGYRAAWDKHVGKRDGLVAMTRLDDDDGLAPWVIERIARSAEKVRRRSVLILPIGIRVWGGRYTLVQHFSNAMQTLVTLPGDDLHVYAYGHRDARRVGKVRAIDTRPAWVWARHPDTISGWRTAERELTPAIRAKFPIDWAMLEAPRANAAGPRGRYYR
jgi:hypothetical protein